MKKLLYISVLLIFLSGCDNAGQICLDQDGYDEMEYQIEYWEQEYNELYDCIGSYEEGEIYENNCI